MTRRRRRELALVAFPFGTGLASALMAPLFDNYPPTMLIRGLFGGLLMGAVWLAIEEA